MMNSSLATSYFNPLAFNPTMQSQPGASMNGFPPYWKPWCPWISWNGNLPDATVSSHKHLWWNHDVKGYGIDLNGNGQYDKGKDGVLAFDYNGDGKLSDNEIQKSRDMLKSMGGDYDFNGDGKVGFLERIRGKSLEKLSKKYDKNGDGRLDNGELQSGNAKVWKDADKDGRADSNELYNPSNIPTPWGRGSIDYVDPRSHTTQIRHPWMPFPTPGPTPQPHPPFPPGPGPSPFPGPSPMPMDPYAQMMYMMQMQMMMQMMMMMMMGGGMNGGGSSSWYFFMMMGGGVQY